MSSTIRRRSRAEALPAPFLATLALAGCAAVPTPTPPQTPLAENVVAVTTAHELIRFNTGQPSRVA